MSEMLRLLVRLILLILVQSALSQDTVDRVETNNTLAIRLKGGDKLSEGRVEILFRGEWGTVCDDGWNIEAATVVCRMLGYDGAIDYVHSGGFGPGSGLIWLDNVKCNGQEMIVTDCEFDDWGVHDCSHHEDAGVKCNARRLPQLLVQTAFVDHSSSYLDVIRLKAAKQRRRYIPQHEGVVEIFHDNKWTKLCINQWKQEVATVVCGQLGFPAAERLPDEKQYLAHERKKPTFWVKNVTCIGVENRLSECEFETSDDPTPRACHTGHPMVVKCVYGSSNINSKLTGLSRKHQQSGRTIPSDIRLKSGSLEGEGRLEIKRNGQWGTVCQRHFSLLSASVACRQLGFGTAKRYQRNAFYGQGHGPIWMTELLCRGSESHLTKCYHSNATHGRTTEDGLTIAECTHQEDVGVSCNVPDVNSKNKIRLVGGRNPMEGRLEVRMRKEWGPVCGIGFTTKDAAVVCRQLGLGFVLNALVDAYFFPGKANTTNVLITGLRCNGDESSIHKCKHDGRNLAQCGDPLRTVTPYAGVICTELSPDLIQDVQLLQQSLHLDTAPLHSLYCAAEENCLAPSAANLDWPYGSRQLLRFSTKAWNRGRADFRPIRSQQEWIWHQCHGHYHSMSEFTHYDIVDLNFTKVAEGHKASFCLEDSQCDQDVSPRFDCDQPGGGTQGIAVGCSDNYQYNIDCQWIDISDVKQGNYLLRIRVNPDALVAESDYANNEVYCNLQYDGHRIWAWNCHIRDDFDEETVAPYYTESVYP